MDPREIRVEDFQYVLPEERIAQYPLPERDASKLLIYRQGEISEDTYQNIDGQFAEGTVLVFNNTKVIPARLHFQTPTGATIEVFCLEPEQEGMDPGRAVTQRQPAVWKCMVGNAKRWKQPELYKEGNGISLKAQLLGREGKFSRVAFEWTPGELSFGDLLRQLGELPIPPYFDRDTEEIDRLRYQTVYAGPEGSVAAPTAGLHFTERVFERLKAKGVRTDFVTLHVGAGTFMPIQGEKLGDHTMHAEWMDVDLALVRRLRDLLGEAEGRGKLVAVGTTAMRTLESLYWMGVKAAQQPDASMAQLEVEQWDPYQLPGGMPPAEALAHLGKALVRLGQGRLLARTRLLVVPSYRPRIVEGLVTNFHQPGSTLLLLIGSLLGQDWRRVYQYAMDHGFRFLSYGDGSLLWRD